MLQLANGNFISLQCIRVGLNLDSLLLSQGKTTNNISHSFDFVLKHTNLADCNCVYVYKDRGGGVFSNSTGCI